MQRREAQDREIEQLRSRLAAEFDAGATRGSQEAACRAEALAAQLAEAQACCSACAADAEAARAEAACLAGARDSAQAAMQALREELEAAKQLVAAQGDGDIFAGGVGTPGGPADVATTGARLAELEEDNRQLTAQLAALQAGAGAHQAGAAGLDGQLAELQQVGLRLEGWGALQVLVYGICGSLQGLPPIFMPRRPLRWSPLQFRPAARRLSRPLRAALLPALQENERLLDLLGHVDAERSRLAREGQDALAELAQLRQEAGGASAAPPGAGGDSPREAEQAQQGAAEQQARSRAAQLEGELAAERRRRQQAEHDFRELLSSMDLMHSSGSTSPSSSTPGGAPQQQQQQPGGEAECVAHLQAAVGELRRENAALRVDLRHSQQRFSTAAAASCSLQSIARGLHSLSADGGGLAG